MLIIVSALLIRKFTTDWEDTLREIRKNYHCTNSALRIDVDKLLDGSGDIVVGTSELCLVI